MEMEYISISIHPDDLAFEHVSIADDGSLQEEVILTYGLDNE